MNANKVAIVTGASRGIGKAIATQLANQGYNLFLTCKNNLNILKNLSTELTENFGIKTVCYQGDLGYSQDVAHLFNQFHEHYNHLDVLINNAGISKMGLFQDLKEEDFDQLMNTNIKSIYLMSRQAIPLLITKKAGHIINISSVWGEIGASYEVAYCASKGAVNSLTKALAKELAPSGIYVNAIAPGAIDTDMNSWLDSEERQQLEEEIPLGRFGTPDEIAHMVSYLLHIGSSYMTGQILKADGGWT